MGLLRGRIIAWTTLLCAAGLAACGGSKSLLSSIPSSGGQTGAANHLTGQVSFKLALNAAQSSSSANQRRPQYVSPATQSASITATQSGVLVGSATGNCTTTACVVMFSIPIGPTTFAVQAFGGPNGTGNLLSAGTVDQTVEANVVNNITVTLNGVVASVQIVPQPGYVEAQSSFNLRVKAYDKSGYQIIAPGAFASPVVVALSATGATVSATSYPVGNSAPVSVTVRAASIGADASLSLTPVGVNGSPAAVQLLPTPAPNGTPGPDPKGDLTFDSSSTLAALLRARPPVSTPLPPAVTLTAFPEINQGQLSSCAAASFAEIMTFLVRQQRTDWLTVPAIDATPPPSNYWPNLFSPAFIFNAMNNYTINDGLRFTDVASFVSANGIATWQDMPYQILQSPVPNGAFAAAIGAKPSSTALQDALGFRTVGLEDIDPSDIQTIRATIANGNPVWVGAEIDDTFGKLNSANNVWLPGKVLPLTFQPNSPPGPHALVLFGYNDTVLNADASRGQFYGMNSWGTGFGNTGVFRISYNDFPRVFYQAVVPKAQVGAAVVAPTPIPSSIPGPSGSPWPGPAATPVLTLGGESFANNITLSGTVVVPAGTGKAGQVDARFYFVNQAGTFYAPVPAAPKGPYSDGFGNAIGIAPLPPLSTAVTSTYPFSITVPFNAFNLQQDSLNSIGAQVLFLADSVPLGNDQLTCFTLTGGVSASPFPCPASASPAPPASP